MSTNNLDNINEIGLDGQPIHSNFNQKIDIEINNKNGIIEQLSDDNFSIFSDELPIDPNDSFDKFSEPGRIRRFATIRNLLNSLLGA